MTGAWIAGCWLAVVSTMAAAQQPLPSPATASPTAAAQATQGTVIFSRSSETKAAGAANPQAAASLTSTITDADRAAVTFTGYALEVHLRPAENAMAVRAQIEVRNDGDQPLKQLPLQLSSTLKWDDVRILAGATVHPAFAQNMVMSDLDHTGSLNEAAVALPEALAPGATLALDVEYSGTIARDATRLQQIGTPKAVAEHSDWDEIAPEFVGLRGFGNVAWYPVDAPAVRLGDGDRFFSSVGAMKLREQKASVSIALTAETMGAAPNIAVLNGSVVPIAFTPGDADAGIAGIARANLPTAPLGFQSLSLFLATRREIKDGEVDAFALPGDEEGVQAYQAAVGMVTPLLKAWLPVSPDARLTLFDLPESDDAPFEERQTVFAPLNSTTRPTSADRLAPSMSHLLTHAYFHSPRPWLEEGVAEFLSTLWIEQQQDRPTALAALDEQRGALALAEPGEDTADAGRARAGLIDTPEAIFYRTKAAYVLWMLRERIGDAALQNTLKAYEGAKDTSPDYFEKLLNAHLTEKISSQMTANLHQFFEDWVYHDRGLPDLSITGVYPNQTSAKGEANAPGSYLVAVEVTNSGGVGAEVPVAVTSATTTVTERLYVPARGKAVRRVLLAGEPTQVQVNDGTVPETTASVHVQQVHMTAAKP